MLSTSSLSRKVSCRLGHQLLYHSRAHPKPRPTYSLKKALNMVLEGVEERKENRVVNWEKRREQRERTGKIKEDGPYRNQEETIEFIMNMNLDPRKPGQNLRGAVVLPHGTGKNFKVAVFTQDEEVAKKALEEGASYAGGESLVDKIVDGTIPVDSFDRSVASQDIVGYLSKKAARVLGPRGLMPNAKVGSLVKTPDDIFDVLKKEMAGQAQYRTEKAGIIHLGIGKARFGKTAILENIEAAVKELYEQKPELYGKGKKPSKNARFILKAYVGAQQGKSFKVDLNNVNPKSANFMSALDED